MGQLHFYLPEELADKIRKRAAQKRMSVSRYISEIVKQEIADTWPDGWFEDVFGGWKGSPLERAPQGDLESREDL